MVGMLLLALSAAACSGGPNAAPSAGEPSHESSTAAETNGSTDASGSGQVAGASECDPAWLDRMSLEGTFEATVRDDLYGSDSLPGVGDAGPVPFNVPSPCVVDLDLGELGISRSYFFEDGVPMTLAESFEAAGWDGAFGYSGGYPDGAYAPAAFSATDPSLAYASISAGLIEASNMDMPGNWYRLQLTPTLVELIGG